MLKRIRLLLIMLLSIALIGFSGCVTGNKECGNFSLNSPSDNASNVALKPTFKWNASENAESYKLVISESENFSGEKLEFIDIKETEYKIPDNLKYATKYYWKVTATGEGENNTKDCNKVFSFTTIQSSSPLGDFELISPANGTTDVALKPVFEWAECQNASSYILTISPNEDFSGEKNVVISDINGTSATIGNKIILGKKTYYWKVTAVGEGENNTKECGTVFSFTTEDLILQGYDNLDSESFNSIYTALGSTHGSITAGLHETPWEGMNNGKSIKFSGTGLPDWHYFQVKARFDQVDMTNYDGIQFWIYPKVADERLGMSLHVINGDYPNDGIVHFCIKGNAPTLVRVPFSKFVMRAESQFTVLNESYITGLWFTFKSSKSLNVGDGFNGTYPDFEIYFDEFGGFFDETLNDMDYQPAYKNEFNIQRIDASAAQNGDLTFEWTKSGAGDEYKIKIATDEAFSSVIYDETITGTLSVKDGIAVYTGTINVPDIQMGMTYYAKMSCGDTETASREFKTADMMMIDFNDLADTAALIQACAGGLTDSKNLVSLSNDKGYNNSKAIKFAANTTDGAADIYFKGLWDFNFDCFEFYYNVPQGEASFFLRLYLDGSYTKRAYVSFAGEGIKLKGSGFIRIPFNSVYMQGNTDVTPAEIDNAVTATGLGIYMSKDSPEFYIDNITLYKQSALPQEDNKLQAASVRNIMSSLDEEDYMLVVQKSYSVGTHKTLYPVVSKTFKASTHATDITAADFENKIADGDKYIYTIYSQSGIVKMGKLEPAGVYLNDLEGYANLEEFAEACKEGIYDSKSVLSLSATGGFNNGKALKIAATTQAADIILKRLWDFPEFDYFEFYYNVPSGDAKFYLRLYLDTASGYTDRAYVDYSNSGLTLSGSGIIRIPVNTTYMSISSGVDPSNVKSSKIKGLGFYVSANSAEFYIDNIKLYKTSALPDAQNATKEEDIRTLITNLANAEGYRLVILKSVTGPSHKGLQPIVNAVFNKTDSTSLPAADFEDKIPDTAANYIYTIYNADGGILHQGTFVISES